MLIDNNKCTFFKILLDIEIIVVTSNHLQKNQILELNEAWTNKQTNSRLEFIFHF